MILLLHPGVGCSQNSSIMFFHSSPGSRFHLPRKRGDELLWSSLTGPRMQDVRVIESEWRGYWDDFPSKTVHRVGLKLNNCIFPIYTRKNHLRALPTIARKGDYNNVIHCLWTDQLVPVPSMTASWPTSQRSPGSSNRRNSGQRQLYFSGSNF